MAYNFMNIKVAWIPYIYIPLLIIWNYWNAPLVLLLLRNKNNNIPFAIPKEKSRDGLYLTIAALVLTIPQAKYIIPFIVITRILQNTHTPKIIRPLGKTTELEDIKAIQAKLLQKSKAEAFFSTSEISEFLRGFQTQADELILAISEEVRTIGTALSPSLFKISIVDSQNVVSAAKKNVQARDQSKPSTTVPPVFQVTSTIEKTTTPIQNQIPNKIIPTSLMSRLFPANKFPNEPIVRAFLSVLVTVVRLSRFYDERAVISLGRMQILSTLNRLSNTISAHGVEHHLITSRLIHSCNEAYKMEFKTM